MTLWAAWFRGVITILACVCLGACAPSGSSQQDEEREPHFLAGKSRSSTLDYEGAIECFGKALQVNPKSSSAHFELAWLYEKEADPAAAIYHYERYLKLRPGAENADLAKQHILTCKQSLAETVSLGPVTEKMQRQLEQVAEENKRLTEDNKRLKDELDKWNSYASRLQLLTNQTTGQTAAAVRSPARTNTQTAVVVLAQVASASPNLTSSNSAAATRTHTVKAGDTPSLIARKYGVKLEALMAANPNLDARRLRVGQILRIPGT